MSSPIDQAAQALADFSGEPFAIGFNRSDWPPVLNEAARSGRFFELGLDEGGYRKLRVLFIPRLAPGQCAVFDKADAERSIKAGAVWA